MSFPWRDFQSARMSVLFVDRTYAEDAYTREQDSKEKALMDCKHTLQARGHPMD